jgi:hypothetical protein
MAAYHEIAKDMDQRGRGSLRSGLVAVVRSRTGRTAQAFTMARLGRGGRAPPCGRSGLHGATGEGEGEVAASLHSGLVPNRSVTEYAIWHSLRRCGGVPHPRPPNVRVCRTVSGPSTAEGGGIDPRRRVPMQRHFSQLAQVKRWRFTCAWGPAELDGRILMNSRRLSPKGQSAR